MEILLEFVFLLGELLLQLLFGVGRSGCAMTPMVSVG